ALVVLLFLQDWRSTLIAVVAVPIALVGSFVFIQLLGFSLNLITLFALVLAIGIVVDNAIVVVEAVHHEMQQRGLAPHAATLLVMGEIAPAIIAITLVMASVFVPLGFISGPAGIFYRQFAFTMAIAIVLSGVVALTLTPSLCATLLRSHHSSAQRSWLAAVCEGFNARYLRLESRYVRLLTGTAARRTITFGLLAAFVAGTGLLARLVPRGFIPSEDQGVFYAAVTSPPGATLERTKEVVDAIAKAGQGLEGVESIASLAGTNVLSDGTGAAYGTLLINLQPWERRSRTDAQIMEQLQRRVQGLRGADIELFPPPAVPGYGNASGFELRLLDKTGRGDEEEMQRVVSQFMTELKRRPEIDSVFTLFNATFPQYTLALDIDRAAQKGITLENALGTMQTLIGGQYATNFIRFGQMYKVMVQAPPEYRATPDQLLDLTVRSDRGEMVPLSAFMKLEKSYGLDQLTRYNMYPSAELNGDGVAGTSSGQVLDAVRETAREKLPRGFAIDWAGISRDEVNAGNQGLVIGLICLLFVYLVLAAQYESFLLPAVVVLSLPPGLFGAFGLLALTGLENNIYAHIALVVLAGLLGKNAILIVEYAERRRREGLDPRRAVLEAARLRLRPILMTSLAFIVGLLPLVFATGAGAVANRTIGTATAGGMLMGTAWGLLLVPGLYLAIQALAPASAGEPSAPVSSHETATGAADVAAAE
ncbi:MAG TPA: efflux RND transporter permease subunit, partial [Polyangiaceae bacterium]|nr:efflux RND transporter permease subunit [Polyangiaceae bacterium]